MRPYIVGIDFDGTCVTNSFPEVGESIPYAIEVLTRFKNAGILVALWTCRENDAEGEQFLDQAVQWGIQNGVPFDAINETPPKLEFRDGADRIRKLYADMYIDDKALGCPMTLEGYVDWLVIERKVFADAHRKGHPGIGEE